jgi:hypothetical protein
VKTLCLASLLTRRLKLISALIIIFAAELCAGCLAVGVINVCLIRRRSRAAGDKQACKQKHLPHGLTHISLEGLFDGKANLTALVD